ncbi:MAG: FxDxF family PEP-CTERM protein [Pelomonas sp.]|nr:FxDxF family PEP-CTERM protein [Roseateles sp.]
MKHLIKTLAVAAALVTAAGAQAQAPLAFPFLPMDPGAPGQSYNAWSFTSGAQASGTSFDDFYGFNIPDYESVTFSIGAASNTPTVDFNGGGYALYALMDVMPGGDSMPFIINPVSDDEYSMTGGAWNLASGTYVLEVAGTFIADGAYAGQITGQPLPEPADLLLAVTALGAMVAVGTLRKRKA